MIYRNKEQKREIYCIMNLRKEDTNNFFKSIIYEFEYNPTVDRCEKKTEKYLQQQNTNKII